MYKSLILLFVTCEVCVKTVFVKIFHSLLKFLVVCNEEMVKHVDTRCKNLLDVKDYSNVMTHVRMVRTF